MAQAEDIISSYVDRTGVQEDTEFMLKSLNDVLGAMKRINDIKVNLEGSASFKAATEATKAYKKEQDELLKIQSQIDAAYKRRIALETEQGKILAEERELLRQRNQELKNSLREQNAAQGSLEQMRATLIRLNKEYDNLSAAERNAAQGQELKLKINGLSEELKGLEGETGRFQRNVGNYNQSAKIIVTALSEVEKKIADLKEKQSGLQNFAAANPIGFKLGNQASELNQVNALLATTEKEAEALRNVTSDPRFFNLSNIGNAKTEVRGFQTTLIELERRGLGRTDFANELRRHLAELTDQIQDTREEIKAMSSDSRAFDQLNTSVRFLTGSYQTFVGVQALAGDQSEEVQKTMTKLIAVQSVANGLQDIAQTLTTRGTIVNKAYAYVQGLVAIATDSTAAATTRLNAALKLSTIGLLIGAIGVVISKYEDWFGTSKKVLDQQKALENFNDKIASSYIQQKQSLDELVVKLQDEKVSLQEKKRVVQELQDQYPNYFKNLRIEKGEVVGLTDGYNKLVQAIVLKSRSQAAGELLAEQEKELLKQGLQIGVTSFEQADKLYQKYKDTKGVVAGIFLSAYENAIATRKELLKIKAEADTALQKLGGDPTPQKNTPTKITVDKKDVEKDLKAVFDVYKVQKERELELLNEIVEDDKRTLAERVSAAVLYVETKQKLIADEAEFEKSLGKKSAEEKQLIDKKASIETIKAAEDVEKKLLEIKERLKKETKSNIEIFEGAVPDSSTFTQINKVLDDYEKKQKLIAETEKQLASERKSRLNDFIDQLRTAAFEFASFGIDKQKNQIQEQIDLLDKRTQKEIEAANQTNLTEQDKAAKIAIINAKAAAQKEQFEKRQRDLDVRKAKLEKESALLSIAVDAAKQVFKIKAEAAVLAANPVTAAFAPVALAQIPLVLISAAIAAALVAAKPIPKYKHGKNVDNYEGMAWVGDGGKSELIVREDGSMEVTPDKPTLTYVKKNDVVIPDANILWKTSKSATDKALGFKVNTSFDGLNKDQYMNGIKRLERAILKSGGSKIVMPNPLDIWMGSDKTWNDFNRR